MTGRPRRAVRRPFLPPLDAAQELTRLAADTLLTGATRGAERLLRRGAHGAPVETGPDRTVLLFFEDVERDALVPGDRFLRRAGRRIYHAVTSGQRVSGFEVAFSMLCTALRRAGCRVVINNVGLARRHPDHPVGICGYPHILERWRLTNPAVLGPGLYDHPGQAPRLMEDPRFTTYLVPCQWVKAMFEPYYGDRCRIWFGGIDVDAWGDASAADKDIDLLVYDKIMWNRESREQDLLQPLLAELEGRGLRTVVVRRGRYGRCEYLSLLRRARGMLFLCEHETQGLAYQEAMACDVPVLAWDPGYWLDPLRLRYTTAPLHATSVPYFDETCGERFRSVEDFGQALDRFLVRLPGYDPRGYVREHLSLEKSARLYLNAYSAAAPDRAHPANDR